LQGRFSELPRYLIEGPGEAYHASALSPVEGLPKYAAIALSGHSGQQWLAARLAREQEAAGILPRGSFEIDFLNGMVCYREGSLKEAERLLRKVIETIADRVEVAIALHIIGRLDGQRGRIQQAEAELSRSITIRRKLDDVHGEAQVLHTLGQLIGRDRRRSAQAEGMLRQSLTILRALGDVRGEAQVLHTLGQLVGRYRRRSAEAEGLLRQSLTLEHDQWAFGEAQVLHTLGQLIGRDRRRSAEAEQLLRQSLGIGEQQKNRPHQAQVLYSLGKLLARLDREDEGIRMLRRSLAINREMHNSYGINLAESELRRLRPNSD